MKGFCYFIAAASLLVVVRAAEGDAFSSGLHGMKWDSPISDYPNLVKVHENDLASYYENADAAYNYAGSRIDSVVYGFYKGKLFAGFINLSTPLQFSNLKNHFTKRYGQPLITYDADGERSVYRWKTDRIKIKLKIKQARNDMKMGIYYTPLSSKLNEAQEERISEDTRHILPIQRGKVPAHLPLLQF